MDTHFEHEPVLCESVLKLISPVPGGVYCDATIGGGGHAEKMLEASAPDGRLVGIDRDPEAVSAARERLARFGERVSIFHGQFAEIEELLTKAGVSRLDGLLVDLGVSSHQLDTAARGFSFMRIGPLDMRMDQTQTETAMTLLERLSEDELADLIYRFGGERFSRRVARSIKRIEAEGRLNTTAELAIAVQRVVGRHQSGGIDPATRTFQAIRIAVNNEIGQLEELLSILPEPLATGGRAVIISFHSLEDRLVKRRFKELAEPCVCPSGMPVCNCPPPQVEYLTRRAVRVGPGEMKKNSRARSSRARAVRRIQ
ncbi:MAG: 16S rRNA (cytosine(1402)-N(4))-methyltransferase RsmH [Deltaproteobacteria bacterium]|nr:16S rRNA (cytosine(1402)-N(4))-methyltransferase RsmH [Deltaproteobacteria bacterium]